MSTALEPFTLAETSPGKFSLLLTTFEPATPVFNAAGLEGGGYSWGSVASHVVNNLATELEGRLDFDPEASMFCAFGADREALEALGTQLARLFHDHEALAEVIQAIGPDNFDD